MLQLTFQQKADALNALCELKLGLSPLLDDARRWHASLRVEIGGDGILRGIAGHGPTPQAAVDELWRNATNIPASLCLIVDAYGDDRRKVRWNGFMWVDVQPPSKAKP
jgi:hypothetical protein